MARRQEKNMVGIVGVYRANEMRRSGFNQVVAFGPGAKHRVVDIQHDDNIVIMLKQTITQIVHNLHLGNGSQYSFCV